MQGLSPRTPGIGTLKLNTSHSGISSQPGIGPILHSPMRKGRAFSIGDASISSKNFHTHNSISWVMWLSQLFSKTRRLPAATMVLSLRTSYLENKRKASLTCELQRNISRSAYFMTGIVVQATEVRSKGFGRWQQPSINDMYIQTWQRKVIRVQSLSISFLLPSPQAWG